MIGDGNVTKDRIEQLNEMRDKLGLGKEAADKIVKGVQNQRLIGDLNVIPLLALVPSSYQMHFHDEFFLGVPD